MKEKEKIDLCEDLVIMTNKLKKELPNGHILYNPGTDNEWEEWEDDYGNTIQKNSRTVVTPTDNSWWVECVGVRCECPFCNESVVVFTDINSCSEVECPECEKSFWVNLEN